MSGHAADRDTLLRWYLLDVVFWREKQQQQKSATPQWSEFTSGSSCHLVAVSWNTRDVIQQVVRQELPTREKKKVRLVFSASVESRREAVSASHDPEDFVTLGWRFTIFRTVCKEKKEFTFRIWNQLMWLNSESCWGFIFRHLILGHRVEGDVELETHGGQ